MSDWWSEQGVIGKLALNAIAIMTLASCSVNATSKVDQAADSKEKQLQSQIAALEAPSKEDLEAEGAVAQSCLQAWRKALAGDEAGAMQQLEALHKKYPKMSTISLMMGQVEERCGKKKLAVKYYRDAVYGSQYSSLHVFKLAEAMRTTGDAKGSIQHYRQLLKSSPGFIPGKLGLAKALKELDPQSKEADQLLKEILDNDPANKEALNVLKGNKAELLK